MKIVIAALPSSGHLNPMLGIGSFLAEQGHEICVYTGTTMRSRVTSLGLSFHPLPAPVDFDLTDMDACFEGRAALSPPAQVAQDFELMFLGALEQQHLGLQHLLRHWPADVVFTEGLFYGALPLVLQNHSPRPTLIQCGICPALIPRRDYAPFGPALPFTDVPEERAHYRDVVGPAVAEGMAPIQAVYANILAKLGLGEPACSFLEANSRHADIFLQCGVPALEYPTGPLPNNYRFLGLPPQPAAPVQPPSWAEDLEDYRRVVLVTLGTVANGDMNRLLTPTVEALASDRTTLVVATGGGRAVEGADQMPDNVRVADYLPFDWILPRIDALVTNGGYGGVLQALAHGVPIVVAGTTEDKSEVAARVAWSGVGVNLATDTPSVAQMSSALDLVLNCGDFRKRAAALAADFRLHDSRRILAEALDAAQRRNAAQFI